MTPPSGRVAATDLLRCLQLALTDHRAHAATGGDTGPLLLAVALDERERLRPVLAEVLRLEDGLLVDTASFSDMAALSGDPAELADLTHAVRDAIAELNRLPGSVDWLRLDVSGAGVRIVGATEFAAASRAQQSLRSLLAALFAEELRANDLAGLAYPEDALDKDHKAIVWRLLMRLPQLLHRPSSSTLLVFAGDAEIDFGLHCAGQPGLRWRVSDAGLHSRQTPEHDRLAVLELARFVRRQAPLVMLMLGAGASAGYLPLGNAVRDRALEHWNGSPVDRHNYPEVAASFFRELCELPERLLPGERDAGEDAFVARLTLERILREERHQERQEFSSTLQWFERQHREALQLIDAERSAGTLISDPLSRLLAMRRRIVMVTVNWLFAVDGVGAGASIGA